jgi:transposase
MTEQDKRQIVSLWESGVALEQIYQMLPYKRYHALKMVQELRADGTLKPRKKTERAIELVALAWQTETKDIGELAEMFGYSVDTIKTYLVASGVRKGERPTTYKLRKNGSRTNEIVDAINSGKTMSQVAKDFKVSRQYIFRLKKKMENQNAQSTNEI